MIIRVRITRLHTNSKQNTVGYFITVCKNQHAAITSSIRIRKNDLNNPILREPDNNGFDFLFPGQAENIKIKIVFASIFRFYIFYHMKNQNSYWACHLTIGRQSLMSRAHWGWTRFTCSIIFSVFYIFGDIIEYKIYYTSLLYGPSFRWYINFMVY